MDGRKEEERRKVKTEMMRRRLSCYVYCRRNSDTQKEVTLKELIVHRKTWITVAFNKVNHFMYVYNLLLQLFRNSPNILLLLLYISTHKLFNGTSNFPVSLYIKNKPSFTVTRKPAENVSMASPWSLEEVLYILLKHVQGPLLTKQPSNTLQAFMLELCIPESEVSLSFP